LERERCRERGPRVGIIVPGTRVSRLTACLVVKTSRVRAVSKLTRLALNLQRDEEPGEALHGPGRAEPCPFAIGVEVPKAFAAGLLPSRARHLIGANLGGAKVEDRFVARALARV